MTHTPLATKYAAEDRDALDADGLYDSLPDLLNARGWSIGEDGQWRQEGAVQGVTLAEARAWEGDIVEVHPCKIGISGKVRVSYETEVWVKDVEAAQAAADQLIDFVPVGDMTFEAPDESDFDGWIVMPRT